MRVVAATNRNLSDMIAAGQFREDLLYRFRVIHIHVPPLREREEDIRVLVQYPDRPDGASRSTFSEDALAGARAPPLARQHPRAPERRRAVGVDDPWRHDPARQLPVAVRLAKPVIEPARERRRQVADELFDQLLAGEREFWTHVHPRFLSRDLTRHDVRQLVGRALSATSGNYRAALKLLGMADDSYKRFLNFLAAHECAIDFRPYRSAPRGATAGVHSGGTMV